VFMLFRIDSFEVYPVIKMLTAPRPPPRQDPNDWKMKLGHDAYHKVFQVRLFKTTRPQNPHLRGLINPPWEPGRLWYSTHTHGLNPILPLTIPLVSHAFL
jgi:hypothetical protein